MIAARMVTHGYHIMRMFGLCVAVGLVGCETAPMRDPEFASVRPHPAPAPASHNGAIYQAGHGLVLFEDLTARQVGDILTIKLVEQTDASKRAETTLDKSNTVDVENPILFGSPVQFNAPGFLPLASNKDNTLEFKIDADREFEGTGESTQSNSLTGDIPVTVVEVLPNGVLVVRGEKLITLNQGHEHIRFSGLVRLADIAADNTVPSTKVAQAQIIYAGEGAVAESNAIGWLGRFFLGAIFPF